MFFNVFLVVFEKQVYSIKGCIYDTKCKEYKLSTRGGRPSPRRIGTRSSLCGNGIWFNH